MNYQHWIQHFHTNRLDRPEPDWAAPFTMPEEERRLLALSLAEYQLGDGGGECKLVARDAERSRGSAEDARTDFQREARCECVQFLASFAMVMLPRESMPSPAA